MMTSSQMMMTVLVVAAGTMLTRFLPFLVFPANKKTPEYVQFLGRTLPFATIGMLVVYCLRGVAPAVYPHALPELITVIVVVALHIWRRNTLISVGVGTLLYMLLVQQVFVK